MSRSIICVNTWSNLAQPAPYPESRPLALDPPPRASQLDERARERETGSAAAEKGGSELTHLPGHAGSVDSLCATTALAVPQAPFYETPIAGSDRLHPALCLMRVYR